MTTNKPGSDQQQPLYGCVSCFEYQTFPADHLRVYDGNCYCEDCWDAYPADADIEWTSLDSFTPALQAECEKLRKDAEFGRSVLSKREPGGGCMDAIVILRKEWSPMGVSSTQVSVTTAYMRRI